MLSNTAITHRLAVHAFSFKSTRQFLVSTAPLFLLAALENTRLHLPLIAENHGIVPPFLDACPPLPNDPSMYVVSLGKSTTLYRLWEEVRWLRVPLNHCSAIFTSLWYDSARI